MLKYIKQNTSEYDSLPYPSKSHPYVKGKSGCISVSGCGVCSSLMVLLNSTTISKSVKDWTNTLIKIGARADGGTDMSVVAKYLKKEFSMDCVITSDISKLKSHLSKGFKAVANVGGKGLFSTGGHYVMLAGLHNDGRAIVLDSLVYDGKFTKTDARKKAFEFDEKTNELYVSFKDLDSDAKGLKYYLFTPTKNIDLKHSAKSNIADAKAKAEKEAAEKKAKAEAAKEKLLAEEKARLEAVKAKLQKEKFINYVVKADKLIVRSHTKSTALEVAKLKKGDKVIAVKGWTKLNGGLLWRKVKIGSKYGYVPRIHLEKVKVK